MQVKVMLLCDVYWLISDTDGLVYGLGIKLCVYSYCRMI